jgi:hypothetical protein
LQQNKKGRPRVKSVTLKTMTTQGRRRLIYIRTRN